MSFLRHLPLSLPRPARPLLLPRILTRSLAVPTPSYYANPPAPPKVPPPRPDGTHRPQLNVPVRKDHGLYKFFHRDEEGKPVPLIMRDRRTDNSGRSWMAAELRRKSFRDLHTLWYVLCRERNVLATQLEEWKKVQGRPERYSNIEKLTHRCRKSMARIKYVLNERRLAFQQARMMARRKQKNDARWARKLAKKDEKAGADGAFAVAGSGSGTPFESPLLPIARGTVAEQPV